MENVTINPSILDGRVEVPSSKSICHRAVICASLAQGISRIDNVVFSKDIEATWKAMETLGAKIKREDNSLLIEGAGDRLWSTDSVEIDCNESGSTLRFMIPVAAATGRTVTFYGRGRLVERPLTPYYKIFDQQGIQYQTEAGKLPLTISGKLMPDEFLISGNISSQFITGLMLTMPLLNGESKIILTTNLESKPYIDLTIDMLERFSVSTDRNGEIGFHMEGNQSYQATDYTVEGDFSQAAFWLVAGAIGGNVACTGLNLQSLQGDRVIMDLIEQMSGHLEIDNGHVKAVPSMTKGITIDVSQCPDLVPILAVLAALSEGRTNIVNGSRLRIKESDRLASISTELRKLGADITETEDGLIINGKNQLGGGGVESWNDHRIAMALAIATQRCSAPVTINGAECVQKSYPDFWKHFMELGGKLDERNLGKQD